METEENLAASLIIVQRVLALALMDGREPSEVDEAIGNALLVITRAESGDPDAKELVNAAVTSVNQLLRDIAKRNEN